MDDLFKAIFIWNFDWILFSKGCKSVILIRKSIGYIFLLLVSFVGGKVAIIVSADYFSC